MKTLTEIAKEGGAFISMSGSTANPIVSVSFLDKDLQAFVDAVNARDSEPVYQVAMNGTWFDTNLVGYIKHSGVKRTLFTSPQPNQSVGGYALVPIEPTEAMLKAGCEAGLDIHALMDDELFSTDKAVYKAMIKSYTNK